VETSTKSGKYHLVKMRKKQFDYKQLGRFSWRNLYLISKKSRNEMEKREKLFLVRETVLSN
jgi:hypothetical protein